MLQIGEFDRTITVSATVDPKLMTFHIPGNSGDPRLAPEFDNRLHVLNKIESSDDLAGWWFWVWWWIAVIGMGATGHVLRASVYFISTPPIVLTFQ